MAGSDSPGVPGPRLIVVTGPPGSGKSTLAEAVAHRCGAAVLGFDWAMAGLTWCKPVQAAIDAVDVETYRRLGWSVLGSLAEAQLRHGRSVVLDGVARDPAVDALREIAGRTGARLTVAVLSCSDRATHRARIEGRRRDIPGWYELTWDAVESTLARWQPPRNPDLTVDTAGDPDPVALAARLLDTGPATT